MSLLTELKRRNVFKVATAYVVVGWLLTEIATTLLPTFGAPDWVAKAIIFIFALAFVPVLVFAWAFELTPEGIKREKDVDRSESITGDTGRKLNYITIAAVVIGVGFIVLNPSVEPGPAVEPEVVVTDGAPSVAVLPFVNMSGNAENEYFSDGLTETLLHMLAQIPELKVAARTSSFAFKDQQDDIRLIADALDVAHVLEGSVQRAGDRVRITAQLIRASDGFHVWSENYDRTLNDIFAIQDEIAGKVGQALSASLIGAEEPAPIVSVGTENLQAYDKFLRAVAEEQKGGYGSLQLAEGLLKDAIALDPDFYDARTLLAMVYTAQWQTGLTSAETGLIGPIRMLEQVLARVPDDVTATTALYEAEFWRELSDNNTVGMKDTIALMVEHARAHPTDVRAVMSAGRSLSRWEKDEEGVRMLQGLTAVDPLNPAVFFELAAANASLDRYEEARQAARRSLELEPEQPNSYSLIARTYGEEGNIVEYLRSYLQAMSIDPKDHELPGDVADLLYRLSLPEHAAEFRDRVLTIAPSSPFAYLVDIRDAEARGDLEAARTAARRAVSDDIDNRGGAYVSAVQFLVSDALDNDAVVETLGFLESTVPSLANFDAPVRDAKEQFVRFAVLNLWQLTLAEEEWRRRYLAMIDHYREGFNWDPEENAVPRATLRMLDGDAEAAIDVLVKHFDEEPVGKFLGWRYAMKRPLFAPVVADPRIQASMAQYALKENELRASVAAFMEKRAREGV
jgi:TolB-like protein